MLQRAGSRPATQVTMLFHKQQPGCAYCCLHNDGKSHIQSALLSYGDLKGGMGYGGTLEQKAEMAVRLYAMY